MAFRAQRDKVVRRISTYLSALDMMDMQLSVLGLPLAALAFVPVPEQHVFTHIPESELFTFLVVGTLRQRQSVFLCFQQLGIELRSLDRYLLDRQ